MGYWARINGKDYPISYDWTLTEEFSESLDSATIRIPHAYGLNSIKPFDDVIIHDYDPDSDEPLPNRPFGKIFKPSNGHFYRHMIVDSRTIEEVSIQPIEGRKLYNYSLQLCSETKALERVQLPNKTISQPMGTGSESEKPSSVKLKYNQYNYSLPINVVSDWVDGTYTQSNFSQLQNAYFVVSIFAGDFTEGTYDMSLFTTMKATVKSGDRFLLPDWTCNGVTVVYGKITYWVFIPTIREKEVLSHVTIKPKKHYIIRKKGVNEYSWVLRAMAIRRCKSYIEAAKLADEQGVRVTGFDEIVNYECTNGTNDIFSEETSSQIPVTLNLGAGELSANYICYLYVEPVYVDDLGILPFPADNNANIFGMTQSSNGMVAPTNTSEFFAMWEFRCVSQDEDYLASGIMSVAEAVREAIELYSPYVKVTDDGKNWRYERKFSLDSVTSAYMQNVIAPENQWNNPNLRDFITRLFYVADCIPVVHDGVITHMNLAQRSPNPFSLPDNIRSYTTSTMDGGSYCDRLLREYEDGLSKDNVCACHERIGFKNMDSPMLTLENLRLELSHPIYRINKVYMCYYDKFYGANGEGFMRLTKQDITPLVILNEKRNLLSEDWSTYENITTSPKNIDELAKFKYATIGYSIGDTSLSGWGTKYSHPIAIFWKSTKTVIENIFEFVRKSTPYGVTSPFEDFRGYYRSGNPQELESNDSFLSQAEDDRETYYQPNQVDDPSQSEDVFTQITIAQNDLVTNDVFDKFFGNYTQRLKSMMFEIEYQGYVSASVIASKDMHDGNVVSRDNASSSLSFVESDGINQKEKANRLGNETITVSARHKTYDDAQLLSQVWDEYDGEEKTHDDEVLFQRTLRFGKDYVTASYYLCKNYVLRNYFTSVFSKHRPFPLASYSQSVSRKENRTLQVLLSPDEHYWQNSSKRLGFSYDVGKLLSFFQPSDYDSDGNLIVFEGINCFHYIVMPSKKFAYSGQCGIFACDEQKFISGNSMCFVVSMKDSVSAGTYVSNFNSTITAYVGNVIKATFDLMSGTNRFATSADMENAANIITGAQQNWHMFPVDPDTGMVHSMSFGAGFMPADEYGRSKDIYGSGGIAKLSDYNIAEAQLLPLLDVVLKRTDGEEPYIYFGGWKDNTYLVGAGYPNIILKKENGKYLVDYSNKGIPFAYSDWVYEDEYDFSDGLVPPFSTYDGEVLSEGRNLVEQFVSAKFFGHETEDSAEESDSCVFKDGKEKMTVTMQIEPVSSSDAIQISPYMMKLSDVMGGKEKRYFDTDVSSFFALKFGISAVNNRLLQDGYLNQLSLFYVPSLTVGVPIGFNMAEYPNGFEIDKSFEIQFKDDIQKHYHLTINKITSIDEANGIMMATCDVTLSGYPSYIGVALPFYRNDSQYIAGATTNMSTISSIEGFVFDPNSVCYPMNKTKYVAYTMCDDRFFGPNAYFRYDRFLINRVYTRTGAGTSESYGLVSYKYGEASGGATPLAYDNGILNYNGYWNYTETFLDCSITTIDILHKSITYDKYNVFIESHGVSEANVAQLKRNCLWCLSPSPVDKSSPFETLNEEPEGAYDPNVFYPYSNFIVERDGSSGMWHIDITLPTALTGYEGASLRMYYLENGKYHFVFGVNLGVAGSMRRGNFIYPMEGSDRIYRIYLSFLDDRSKTVIDAISGDPLYRVVNYASQSDVEQTDADPANPENLCIEK